MWDGEHGRGEAKLHAPSPVNRSASASALATTFSSSVRSLVRMPVAARTFGMLNVHMPREHAKLHRDSGNGRIGNRQYPGLDLQKFAPKLLLPLVLGLQIGKLESFAVHLAGDLRPTEAKRLDGRCQQAPGPAGMDQTARPGR